MAFRGWELPQDALAYRNNDEAILASPDSRSKPADTMYGRFVWVRSGGGSVGVAGKCRASDGEQFQSIVKLTFAPKK